MNAKRLLLKNALVRTSRKTLNNCSVVCEKGTISTLTESITRQASSDLVIDCAGLTVVPGFIDMHLHGFGGRDSREGTVEAVQEMAAACATFGVTSLLPTLTVLSDDNLRLSTRSVRDAMNTPGNHAHILGVHLEGPFLNPQYKGGIFGGGLSVPSLDVLAKCLDYAGDTLRVMTLAPELAGAEKIIERLFSKRILVSLGHSGATYAQAIQAMRLGCRHVAHLFNGMTSITARDPGLAGAALYEDECCVEVIADGHHIAVANVLATLKMKPLSMICLVTDASKASGTDLDGFDNPSGFRVEIRDGRTWGPEGKLVGSVLTLDAAVRHLLSWSTLDLTDVLAFVTENPARQLGLYPRKGDIAPGADADLTVLDADHRVAYTIVGGRVVYRRT